MSPNKAFATSSPGLRQSLTLRQNASSRERDPLLSASEEPKGPGRRLGRLGSPGGRSPTDIPGLRLNCTIRFHSACTPHA